MPLLTVSGPERLGEQQPTRGEREPHKTRANVRTTAVRHEGHVLDLVIARLESVCERNLVLGEVVHPEELRGEHEACRGRVRQPAGLQDVPDAVPSASSINSTTTRRRPLPDCLA